MPGHDIIVVGASMGGLEALRALVSGLAEDLPAALFIVWHMPAESYGLLPELLQRVSFLPVTNAQDGEPIQLGRVHVAPPDQHLLIEAGRVRLTRGPKENRFRPAVDPLFRSAAYAYGPRVVGIVLSGALDDGAAGLRAVKKRGGLAIVQAPQDAIQPSMPKSAMKYVSVDYVAAAHAIGPLLNHVDRVEVVEQGGLPVSDNLQIETRSAFEDNALAAGVLTLGQPSPFTCPECHGTLLEVATEDLPRFRCHTGHAFSIQSLIAQVSASIEETLWNSIRAIEERMMLLQHVARHLQAAGDAAPAEQLLAQAREAEQQAQLIKLVLLRRGTTAAEPPAAV